MRTIAILPVKSFGAAKQRLAGRLGAGPRQALAQAMFSDVLASLRRRFDRNPVRAGRGLRPRAARAG
jgi:2-phospho-L-lactate guanylyltransferase (CobY/MobA/RfbA family)